MKRLFHILAATAATCTVLACQDEFQKEVEAFEADLAAFREDIGNIGMSVALVKDGHIVYKNAFGVKDLETNEPVDTSTLFRIASISKSFTSTSMMQMIDSGKLSLKDKASDLAGFPIMNPKFPEDTVTIEQMLSHTSSINDSEGYYITLTVIDPSVNENWANCYNNYAPGEGFEYCNLNYNLLGCFLEKLSGERFDQYVVRHILNPLGLYGGYCVDSLDTSRFAKLYSWNGESFDESTDAYAQRSEAIRDHQLGIETQVFSPTGGMKISAPDLARYMIMHMNYGVGENGVRIIPEELSREMQTMRCVTTADSAAVAPQGRKLVVGDVENDYENYGLALCKTDEYSKGVMLVGHTGGAYGLRSAMFFNPEEKYGFVVISNGSKPYASDGKTNVLNGAVSLMYKHFIQK